MLIFVVLICPRAVCSIASTPLSLQTIAKTVRDLILALQDITYALESIVAHTHSMHDGMVDQLVMLQREMMNQVSALRVEVTAQVGQLARDNVEKVASSSVCECHCHHKN